MTNDYDDTFPAFINAQTKRIRAKKEQDIAAQEDMAVTVSFDDWCIMQEMRVMEKLDTYQPITTDLYPEGRYDHFDVETRGGVAGQITLNGVTVRA